QTVTDAHGQVPKWTKGADCKSVAIGFQGSNPCLPTKPSLLGRLPCDRSRQPEKYHPAHSRFWRSELAEPAAIKNGSWLESQTSILSGVEEALQCVSERQEMSRCSAK